MVWALGIYFPPAPKFAVAFYKMWPEEVYIIRIFFQRAILLFNALFHAQSVRICGSEIHDMAQAPDLPEDYEEEYKTHKTPLSQCGKIVWFYGTNRLEKNIPFASIYQGLLSTAPGASFTGSSFAEPRGNKTNGTDSLEGATGAFFAPSQRNHAPTIQIANKRLNYQTAPFFGASLGLEPTISASPDAQHRKGNSSTSAAGQSSGVLWTPS